jgi:hypothetical protein
VTVIEEKLFWRQWADPALIKFSPRSFDDQPAPSAADVPEDAGNGIRFDTTTSLPFDPSEMVVPGVRNERRCRNALRR